MEIDECRLAEIVGNAVTEEVKTVIPKTVIVKCGQFEFIEREGRGIVKIDGHEIEYVTKVRIMADVESATTVELTVLCIKEK